MKNSYCTNKSECVLFFDPINNSRLLFTHADFFLLNATNRNNFQSSCITGRIVRPEGPTLILVYYYYQHLNTIVSDKCCLVFTPRTAVKNKLRTTKSELQFFRFVNSLISLYPYFILRPSHDFVKTSL